MTSPTDRWERARQLQQAGDLAGAELAYQQVIQNDPGNAEAWERLGEVNEAQGKIAEAVSHYRHVVRIKPDSADAYFRLGCIHGSQQNRAEAMASFRQALRYRPDHVEALTSLGVALAEQGNFAEALPNLRAAARLQPESGRIHYNLGVALVQGAAQSPESRRWREEGEQALQEAIRLDAAYPAPHYGLGNLKASEGKTDEAIACFREALRLKPDYQGACNNLGLALIDKRSLEEAVVLLRHAVRLAPSASEAHNNLGLALSELGRFAEAEASYLEALRIEPRYADAHNNLGSAYKEQGRLEEALACYQLALWLQPELASVHWNRSLALLQMGSFEDGWPEYEWRWKRAQAKPRPFREPRWDGSALDGRVLLIYMEQGLGDAIQFIRYATLAKARGAQVVVECPASLVSLFSTCPGIDALVAEATPLPHFDVQVPVMSLPGVFKTTVESVPGMTPYLSARADKVTFWQEKIDRAGEFKIGIAWQGNPKHPWDRHRSFPLEALEPLTHIERARLFSLQKGPGVEQPSQLGRQLGITELAAELDPGEEAFADTAGIIVNLDLVITADTAVAHLAGALGARVWVALSAIADWRWLRGRNESPWYPTMRLFRQAALGRWGAVFEDMARALEKEIRIGNFDNGRIADGVRQECLTYGTVEVSPGELIDKMTILEIKSERMKEPAKLHNVRRELAALRKARERQPWSPAGLAELEAELKGVNESLWEIEEGLRAFERTEEFGAAFVELARSVYRENDRRAAIKRKINDLLGSRLVEEKSYDSSNQPQAVTRVFKNGG